MAQTAILTIKILADAAKAAAGLEKTATKAQKLGAGFRAAAIPAAAALATFAAMGQAASNLAETQAKVGQVFGESAGSIEAWAATSATAIGQSEQQALDAAASFAVFGKSAGLAGGDLVGFSTDMTTLASDMASFSNTTPEDAIAAIGSALRGEAEPIRKYGVLLDDATLKAQAMKLGIIDSTKQALTPQQKVLAAQAEILAQTSDAQGDFARTSDGAANQQRILNAQMADAKAQIGQAVLPAMQALIPILSTVAGFLAQNSDVVGPLIIILAALAVVIWAVNAAMLANPVVWIIIGIAALIAVVVIAYKKCALFRTIVQTAFKLVGAYLSFVWNTILKPVFTFLIAVLKAVWTAAKTAASNVVRSWNAIKGGVSAAWSWLKSRVFDPYMAAVAKLVAIVTKMRDQVVKVWTAITTAISTAWNNVKNFFDKIIGKIQDVIGWFTKLKPPEWLSSALDTLNPFSSGRSVGPPPAPAVAGRSTGRAVSSTSTGVDRGAGPMAPVINVYLDGKKIRGVVQKVVDAAMDRDGARLAGGVWA